MKRIRRILFFILIFNSSLSAQVGTWTWMNGDSTYFASGHYGTKHVFSPANTPPALENPCVWTDNSGYFWLFGGLKDTIRGSLDDLWKFDPNTNQWAWINGSGRTNRQPHYGTQGVPSSNNTPGARMFGCTTWVDTVGNLWLFGGQGYDTFGNLTNFNDLWMYSPSLDQWTWVKGPNQPNQWATFGTQGVPSPSNNPENRCVSSVGWRDSQNNLWLFGGDAGTGGAIGTLWKYDIAASEWTWMSGSQWLDQTAVYGQLGVPSPTNQPGGRLCWAGWKDSSDNLWLYGGDGTCLYGDLWKYAIASNQWTWMSGHKGSSATDSAILATPACISSSANVPFLAMYNSACWTTDCDHFKFYAHYGRSSPPNNGFWDYSVSSNSWAWISPSYMTFNPNWGVKTIPSPLNNPGTRNSAVSWKDNSGNLWMFGGLNWSSNDLWKYIPDPACPSQDGFSANVESGCVPLHVTFNNYYLSNTTYQWDFGDGHTSTAVNPTHIYTDTGSFTVTLIATRPSSPCQTAADTLIKRKYIQTQFCYTTRLYPTLNQGAFTLEYKLDSPGTFYIYDAVGKLILKQPLSNLSGKEDFESIHDLTYGIYFWEVETDGAQPAGRGKFAVIK